jgi:hypothetical protein
MADVRLRIVTQYAEWTALSALRSGAPIKSRRDVYTAIRRIAFAPLFDESLGPIDTSEFDAWHSSAVADLIEGDPRLNVGWAAKIVNVYLKTRCYVGGQGRKNLDAVIHPPIDAGLWLGLRRRFADRRDILDRSNCVTRIKQIDSDDCYARIIDGCRAAAEELQCKLIEVEQLWLGTELDDVAV